MGDESDDDEKDIRCSPIHAMYEMFANFILSFNEFISINSVLNYLVYSVYIYIYIYIYIYTAFHLNILYQDDINVDLNYYNQSYNILQVLIVKSLNKVETKP